MATVKIAKERKPRQPKVKAEDLIGVDLDLHIDEKPKRAPRASSAKNEVIKSKLSLIIELLDMDDGDDKLFMKNRPMCVRNLKEIMTLL